MELIDAARRSIRRECETRGYDAEHTARVLCAFDANVERNLRDDPERDTVRAATLDVIGRRLTAAGMVLRRAGPDGAMFDHPGWGQRFIVSVARENDGEVWLHASVSRKDLALPTYDHVKRLHRLVWPDATAVQLFVPDDRHVNDVEALHLWWCLTRAVVPDFTNGTGVV